MLNGNPRQQHERWGDGPRKGFEGPCLVRGVGGKTGLQASQTSTGVKKIHGTREAQGKCAAVGVVGGRGEGKICFL